MSTPLLSTKFNIPPVGTKFVNRPRLLRILDAGLEKNSSLILVCGPAGYGKTSVVCDWLRSLPQSHPNNIAWLTLESGDDDLPLFLTYWITALQHILPGFGEGVLKMLQTHKPPSVIVLATILMNELSNLPGRVYFVLDDYHLLKSEPFQAFITFLVDHQLPQFCLVLITRNDPPLPLARLRARGQLVELRQEALCFQKGEVEEFINREMNLRLSAEQLSLLERRTEGWVSGLQLAALSLKEVQDKPAFFERFSGEDKFIADYLTGDVLAGLSFPVQTFLLQTSILEVLSVPLCEFVTNQAGAQLILDQLMEANLFIRPLDNQGIWYRYHALFADLLRKRLQDKAEMHVHDLHLRASRWFEENDLIEFAIEHAIAGQDTQQSIRLIELAAENLLMHGQAATLLRWLNGLPQDALLQHQYLATLEGLALILCNRASDALSDVINGLVVSDNQDEFSGEVATLKLLLAILQGRSAEAIHLGEQALRQLPAGRVFFRSLAADGLGMAYTLAGDIDAAKLAFEEVVESSIQSGNVMMHITALTNLSGLQYVQGHLNLAIHTCRQVVEVATQRIGRQTPMLGKTLLNLGDMLREQGDLEAAQTCLFEAAGYMEVLSEIGIPMVWLAIARIYMSKQDWSTAQTYIDKARQRAQSSRTILMDDRLVEIVQARFWLIRGDLEPALQWVRGLGYLDRSPADVFKEATRNAAINELLQAEYLTVIRIVLAQRHPERALEMLSFLHEWVKERGYQRRIIEILALKALALDQKGFLDESLQTLSHAFTLAEPEGYQRIFVDEGDPMAQLLYKAVAHKNSLAYSNKLLQVLLAQRDNLRRLESTRDGNLVEPLSQREQEVLQLIDTGLSNDEIAARLYITLSTVKGHTTNIFGKLNVKNRTQAVARAHDLGLLPSNNSAP